MNLEQRIQSAILRDQYAKHRPAANQRSMFEEEDHPRDESGEFAKKTESSVIHADKNDVDTSEPETKPKSEGSTMAMTHMQLAEKVSEILNRHEDMAGKIVRHKDGAIRVYLKENKGGKRGWEETGSATINEDGQLELDNEFKFALRYDKPLMEEIGNLSQAQNEARIIPVTTQPTQDHWHPDHDDPLNRMEREKQNSRDRLEQG